MKSRLL